MGNSPASTIRGLCLNMFYKSFFGKVFLLFLSSLLLFLFFNFIKKYLFLRFHYYFMKNKKIGKIVGIKYVNSSNWKTNRKESKLFIDTGILEKIIGIEFPIGDIDFIKSFRKRQLNPSFDFEIYENLAEHENICLIDLEKEIIKLWGTELKKCYDL